MIKSMRQAQFDFLPDNYFSREHSLKGIYAADTNSKLDLN